ncbi:Alpha/Beta hydrolase protein [Haematococcus lacustris]
MFYFYFEARHRPESAPVVLWMTGGPGCSSELAVLFENGPYTLTANGTLEENEFGWDTYHHMIYVDQPINTGFSYSDDPRDRVYGEDMVGEDMLDFLRAFYQARPELQELPLYITGESYAGHYVPAVAHRVFLANKNQEGPAINFKGLAIGNGLTNPAIQFNAYGDFALQNGLISSMTRSVMSFLFPLCSIASTLCDSTNWSWLCDLGVNYCMSTQFQPILVANPDINVYDILRKCEGPLCYDFSAADSFLNSKATQKALGVDKPWVSCDMDVYQDFTSDWLHRFDTVLPDMLADGIRVQIYAGDLDLICNYLGNRRWVDALEWSQSTDWATAEDQEWSVKGFPAGQVTEVGPLSFVKVFMAGHMVPMDQPLHSLAHITAFTHSKSLASLSSSLPSTSVLRGSAAAGKSDIAAYFAALVSQSDVSGQQAAAAEFAPRDATSTRPAQVKRRPSLSTARFMSKMRQAMKVIRAQQDRKLRRHRNV